MSDVKTAPEPAKPEAEAPAKGTRRTGLILAVIVLVLLILHLFADRITPYSSQARVHAYVVAIAPEVGGTVRAVHVKNNQLVRRGQPLFTLGKEQFLIAADKARADISAVQRELKAQDAGIKVAEANVAIAETDQVKTGLDATRFARIYKEDKGAVSVRRVEQAKAAWDEARSRVLSSRAQLEQAIQARGQPGEANDRLLAARAALAKAELDLSHTTVFAPGDGLVTDLTTDVGLFAGGGSPVMTFIAIHDGWVTADMTENNLGRMKPGAEAEIVLDVLPGEILTGRVRSVGYGVSAQGGAKPGALPEVENSRDFLRQAQRFPVIIEFEPDQLAKIPGLREGGQADVVVYTGENWLLNSFAWIYIRVMSLLSYAY